MNQKTITLIADIGGTNARFGLIDLASIKHNEPNLSKHIYHKAELHVTQFTSLPLAIEHYIKQLPDQVCIIQACLAVAAPINDDYIEFINSPWSFDQHKLKAHFSWKNLYIINDFTAVACAIDTLEKASLSAIHQPKLTPAAPIFPLPAEGQYAVMGVGTGLGTAALKRQNNRSVIFNSEAGHCGFAPQSKLQFQVAHFLSSQYHFVCNENILSGYGVVNLYIALAHIKHYSKPDNKIDNAAAIFAHAQTGDPLAIEAVSLFFEILAQVSANTALSFAATDGLFLCGGILQKQEKALINSDFKQHFTRRLSDNITPEQHKNSYRNYLSKIPVYLINEQHIGLIGAANSAASLQ